MANQNLNPKVDAYIAKARPFAQPILTHLRTLIHKGCPGVEETIKWGRPFFEYRGAIICFLAAFKEHCSLGFWGQEIKAVLREAKVERKESSGSFGKIKTVEDLPPDELLAGWIRQTAAMIESGNYTSPIAARTKTAKPKKAAVKMPAKFSAALRKNKKAAAAFEAFSPSGKREYVEWIAEAKRPETRDNRIATAVKWIGKGKQRNWKYAK
jgi:uncharacterized protein YdeI (YjbR/CyaY-like superfamily)